MAALVEHILAVPGWLALLLVFALPALEASAFVGIVVPGELAVLLGGVLAFQHRVGLAAAVAAAVAGAVVGDSAGYLVGRRLGPRLLASRAGRLVKAEHRERAERFLRERGGAAVFLGRFTAVLRALLPGLAGMAGMPYGTFARWNVAGGAVWASAFVLLGYAAGDGWRRVAHATGRAGLVLLAALAVVALVALAARWAARHQERVRVAGARLAAWPPLARLLATAARAGGFAMAAAFAALAGLGWAFGVLLEGVVSGESGARVDQPVLDWLLAHRAPWLTGVMAVLTDLGASWLLIPLVVAAGLALRLRGQGWRPLGLLAAPYAGAWALSTLVKAAVGRPRPPLAAMAVQAGGLAFPSGHATNSTAVYGMLAVLAVSALASWRAKVAAAAGLVLVVLAVGFSRAYLGVHWATDVVAGWALGGAWLLALLAATRRRPPKVLPSVDRELGGRRPAPG